MTQLKKYSSAIVGIWEKKEIYVSVLGNNNFLTIISVLTDNFKNTVKMTLFIRLMISLTLIIHYI